MNDLWWDYWFFHLPNYALAVLIYTMFGRFLLSLFLPPDSRNYIFRWFIRLTDWVVGPVAYITPSAIAPVLLPPIAAFWLIVLRIAFFIAMFRIGLLPASGQGG
jgi:YggT family protein